VAGKTKITWADHTQNFWEGCTRVSPACDHCYAASRAYRFKTVEWDAPPRRTSPARWKEPFKWDRDAAAVGVRRRVFSLSLGDFFDNQVPPEWRAEAWEVIAGCRNLDWMILTKRPQNIAKMLPGGWPWPHVWLGVTAEDQAEADRRLPILLRIPAVVHFASVEPQLEPVDLRRYLAAGLGWAIVGGESLAGCRPFDPDWARVLRDQCRAAGAAFFLKQLGGYPSPRHHLEDLPSDLRIWEWPVGRQVGPKPASAHPPQLALSL
jgi:protein gp37